MYIIEAVERVRIDKLVQCPGSSFLSAYCLPKPRILQTQGNYLERNEELCRELFNKLKVYLRLEQVHRKMLAALMRKIGTPEELDGLDEQIHISMSPAVAETRPSSRAEETAQEMAERHELFFNAVATLMSFPATITEVFMGSKLVQFSPYAMQALYEKESLEERLLDLITMLNHAAERKQTSILMGPGADSQKEALIAEVNIKGMGVGEYADYGEDLLPPSWFKPLSLADINVGEEKLNENANAGVDLPGGILFRTDTESTMEGSLGIDREQKDTSQRDPFNFDEEDNVLQ